MASRRSTAIGVRKDRSASLTVGNVWDHSPSPVSDFRTMDLANSAYMKMLQNALKAEMRLSETTRTQQHASKLDSAKLKLSKFDLKYSKQSSLRSTLIDDSDDSNTEEQSAITPPSGEKQTLLTPDEKGSEVERAPESNVITENIADVFHTSKNISAINKEDNEYWSPPHQSPQQVSFAAIKNTDIHSNTLPDQKIEFLPDETITDIEENLSVNDSSIKTVVTDSSLGFSNIHSIASLVESDNGGNSPGVKANTIKSPEIKVSNNEKEVNRKQSSEKTEAAENKPYHFGKSSRSESLAGGIPQTLRRDKSDSKSDSTPFIFSNIKTIEDLFDQQPGIHKSLGDEGNMTTPLGINAHSAPGSPINDHDITYEDTFSEEGTPSSIRNKGISSETTAQAQSRKVEEPSPVRYATLESVPELKEEPLPMSGEPPREIFPGNTPLAASRSPDTSSPANPGREKRRSKRQKQQRAETSEIKHASVAVQTLISCRTKSRGTQVALSPSSVSPSSGRSHSVSKIAYAAVDEPNVPVLRTIRLPVGVRRNVRSVSKSEEVGIGGDTGVRTGSTPSAETGFCCPFERAVSDLLIQQLDLTQQLVQRQYRMYLANCRAVQLLEKEYQQETQLSTKQSIRSPIKQKKNRNAKIVR